MKIHFAYCLLFIVSLTVSCKKDDAAPSTSAGVPLGTLTCKKDGKDYTSTFAFFSKSTNSNGVSLTFGGAASLTSTTELVSMTFSKYQGVKKYDVDGLLLGGVVTSGTNTYSTLFLWNPSVSKSFGTVTITNETSTNLEGTFSFSAKGAVGGTIVNVTEGKFNAKVQ
jgi:hypothetical protein